jgi:hypothetical protein
MAKKNDPRPNAGDYNSPSPRISKINQKPYRAPSSTGKKP